MVRRQAVRPASRRTGAPAAFLQHIDLVRLDATRRLDPGRRSEFGQFLTPAPVARFMAGMFKDQPAVVRLLDAGAGVGSLTAAYVASACAWPVPPKEIHLTSFEIDPILAEYLRENLEACRAMCEGRGIRVHVEVCQEDFITTGAAALQESLFHRAIVPFTAAILNPPYKKIHSSSRARLDLRSIGIETTNFYTAFLLIATRLLEAGGELVSITPRSFCNGPYFRPFRREFLTEMALKRLHVFETRTHAFEEDDVLQENVITYAVKTSAKSPVEITSSTEPSDDFGTVRTVAYDDLVRPTDPDVFIRIVADETESRVADRMERFDHSVEDLGLSVSTGRVVDFRAKTFLRADPAENTAPLIYPMHFDGGFVSWPKPGAKKANALEIAKETDSLLVPSGVYVLVKRFSAKEERRRIVTAVYDPTRVSADRVGFENHLNYYHAVGKGMRMELAKGLAAFLSSTLVDSYFRQFNGHTQVNATDLRSFKYPAPEDLVRLGARIREGFPNQTDLDALVDEELFPMADSTDAHDPIQTKRRIEEATAVLKSLEPPREQQNDRSALTLLALLGLSPTMPWADATAPLLGITPIMALIAHHYGRRDAPNTRETIRRFSMHQFVEAGLVVPNPDKPSRPVNSPKAVYQIEPSALVLLQAYGSPAWEGKLKEYLSSIEALQRRHATEREMERIPLRMPSGKELRLSPGGQNVLVKQIFEEFCPRFTPGAAVIYVGDTEDKLAYFDQHALSELGVTVDEHGKMPDVIIHDMQRNWLVLIEAVTSHGPVNAKRQAELQRIFGASSAGLVFVTAFMTRNDMKRYLSEISWETEVWVADAPSHLIHFNGARLLGPYTS